MRWGGKEGAVAPRCEIRRLPCMGGQIHQIGNSNKENSSWTMTEMAKVELPSGPRNEQGIGISRSSYQRHPKVRTATRADKKHDQRYSIIAPPDIHHHHGPRGERRKDFRLPQKFLSRSPNKTPGPPSPQQSVRSRRRVASKQNRHNNSESVLLPVLHTHQS